MENQTQQIKIKARDEELKGNYSNIMQVIHTKEEFVLDFFSAFAPEGILVSRIIMSPGHLKRLVEVLRQNVKNYEEKFGQIVQSQIPEIPIGFHSENK
jgi:hypothetical protein